MPEISVIIPVFNAEKYVSETLESVLNQTFQDFEVVCIDDGSKDNSLEILEQFKSKDNRIRVISQKNSGVVNARNNAIEIAEGEYIFPLDSDDLIDKTLLEKEYKAIKADKGDVITCRVQIFGRESQELYLPRPSKINMSFDNCLVNAALFRKDLFMRAGGYDANFSDGLEDYDLWLNLLFRHSARFYRIPEILFFYRFKPSDESRNEQQIALFSQRLKDKIINKYPELVMFRRFGKLLNCLFQIKDNEDRIVIKVFKIKICSLKKK